MPSEAQARLTINRLLEEAGWRLFPGADGRRANVICEHRVSGKRFAAGDELGADFEKATGGFADYLLLNDDDRAVAVVEAKRESIDPLVGKEQARSYAERLGVSHVFLSNGQVHYYWNLTLGNPTRVSRLLPLEELGKAVEWRRDPVRFAAEPVDENYIAVSQDAGWLGYGAAERQTVAVNKKIRLLRDYQLEAVQTLQRAVAAGKERFLFEMATGTGKTLLSAAIAKLYLRTGNATRILFLVDRLELETQAWKNFNAYLASDGIISVIYKKTREDWRHAQVVITTIQSLAARNRFLTEFAPADFQLIISDEAHRTINGNNRAIFEYFIGAKLGLTATPRDYLKGVDQQELQANDPRALERRLILDTYTAFGCGDGNPTFRYDLLKAVGHTPPYLVNPTTLDARTEITTKMLSEEGYVITKPVDEDGEEAELEFTKRDYERTFFSNETNQSFVGCFLDNAMRDPVTCEVGKTIFFAVSRRHATKLVTQLNEEAARRWPDVYGAGSSFSVQVTSDIPGAQQMTVAFANNNLNGKSRWRQDEFSGYDTSRTRVCVTVGMMTTGYDCEDLLNVVLARPIFSPTDFIQIKGRGTRLYTFKHPDGNVEHAKDKKAFALFDFFANCEFFEDEYEYDKKLELPRVYEEGEPEGGGGEIGEPAEPYANTSPDPMANVTASPVGLDGMRVDREMFRARFAAQARDAATADTALRESVEAENWPAVEEQIKHRLFDKPKEFWNLDKLRELYRTDRNPSLREILQVIFGVTPAIPTREELAAEHFQRYLSNQACDPTKTREISRIFHALVLDETLRDMIAAGKFAEIQTVDMALYQSLRAVDREQLKNILAYIRREVPIDSFNKAA